MKYTFEVQQADTSFRASIQGWNVVRSDQTVVCHGLRDYDIAVARAAWFLSHPKNA